MPTEEEVKAAAAAEAEKAKASEDEKAKAGVNALSPQQITQAFQYMVQQNRTLATELATVKGQVAGLAAAPRESVREDAEPDVETLSNGQLVQHIFKKIETAYVKPAADRIANNEGDLKAKAIRDELKDITESHPEFWEFKEEVKAVLESYPDLSISDAFAVAKTRAPATVQRLEEAKTKERMEKETKTATERKKSFGGLLPTSGKTAPSAHMSAKEAAESAWEDLDMDEHLSAISAS